MKRNIRKKILGFNPFITAVINAAAMKPAVKPFYIVVGKSEDGLPICRERKHYSRSKYQPHQGKKECAKRLAAA